MFEMRYMHRGGQVQRTGRFNMERLFFGWSDRSIDSAVFGLPKPDAPVLVSVVGACNLYH